LNCARRGGQLSTISPRISLEAQKFLGGGLC
jgi:hypothetical protein